MLLDFLNFLGVSGGATAKKRPIIADNTKKTAEEFIVEMQSPYFQEEITTETVIKDDKKIEIKILKTSIFKVNYKFKKFLVLSVSQNSSFKVEM